MPLLLNLFWQGQKEVLITRPIEIHSSRSILGRGDGSDDGTASPFYLRFQPSNQASSLQIQVPASLPIPIPAFKFRSQPSNSGSRVQLQVPSSLQIHFPAFKRTFQPAVPSSFSLQNRIPAFKSMVRPSTFPRWVVVPKPPLGDCKTW